MVTLKIALFSSYVFLSFQIAFSQRIDNSLDIPDQLIMEAYEKASKQNVLAAVNPKIFFGYFSVCADGVDFGYGNTYPSLDGHQMSDALLWLGQVDVVKANWDYVKGFQKTKGELPIAILPSQAGKNIGPPGFQSLVDLNGGLYRHWVPGDPLRALAGTTYIQNADVIFRFTQDLQWLSQQLPSVNLTADYLASMVTAEGAVSGAGYYVERPTRLEYDGVSQCHAAEAFDRVASLNNIVGNNQAAKKYQSLAKLVQRNFRKIFWVQDHFAEYIHPQRGIIAHHGLTDVDWSAIATGMATERQQAALWPRLKDEKHFYYNGMPTGIATRPETYEKWETTYADNQDLAAMGRVWYLEARARANMNDGKGLVETIRAVCKEGRSTGYYWRERYNDKGGYGAKKYNEYPANLIRIIQRFLLGVEHGLDGTLFIGPTAPEEFWNAGFGQTLSWGGASVTYKMEQNEIKGEYSGKSSQKLSVRFDKNHVGKTVEVLINGTAAQSKTKDGWISILLPSASNTTPCSFSIKQF
ncbi:MAG: hypothetical protein ABIR06_04170 [Cyclobacteriaceae bacterium]